MLRHDNELETQVFETFFNFSFASSSPEITAVMCEKIELYVTFVFLSHMRLKLVKSLVTVRHIIHLFGALGIERSLQQNTDRVRILKTKV